MVVLVKDDTQGGTYSVPGALPNGCFMLMVTYAWLLARLVGIIILIFQRYLNLNSQILSPLEVSTIGKCPYLLGSFNGPEPGGLESMIRKWKRELEGGRERERKKDTGTEALMEQRCFNDLSVSIYRLLYKKCLLTMIKIRKPNIQQPLPREQGINNGHRLRRQSIPQERGSRLSSFVVKRMFTEGDSSLSHIMTSVLEAACCSTDKEQRTYEKQQVGILLSNTPWYLCPQPLLWTLLSSSCLKT